MAAAAHHILVAAHPGGVDFCTMPSIGMASLSPAPSPSHPDLGHLTLLVFEAVLEVVCIALPGYLIASLGHFDQDKQKFLANLNVMLFTPCLVFSKLAFQLNGRNLSELAIIPVIFAIQTMVSWLVASVVIRVCRFDRRASNFVTAMAVFGNSNSLPISLVLSLSQTIEGLHWDRLPGDRDEDVAARGILYLLVFQQLGQLVRWSWGYHVLLAPKDKQSGLPSTDSVEAGRYYDSPDLRQTQDGDLIPGYDGAVADPSASDDSELYEPSGRTPIVGLSRQSPTGSDDGTSFLSFTKPLRTEPAEFGRSASVLDTTDTNILSFPRICTADEAELADGLPGVWIRLRLSAAQAAQSGKRSCTRLARRTRNALPPWARTSLDTVTVVARKTNSFLWTFMNPPLWAMLAAVLVASVPSLHTLFFQEGSFVKNSVTSAIRSSAGVAVPLILVVLGANLARSTQSRHGGDDSDEDARRVGPRKLLIASLLSRMFLPTLIMAPILALMAKWLNISILDDPIFVVVCFLLSGAPSALQLAQICQINGVFEGVMSSILFQSYVVWILPSTLVLVTCALKVVDWVNR